MLTKIHRPDMPVWTITEFLILVGEDVVEDIETSNAKRHRYFNRLMKTATSIDLNDPRYYGMLEEYFAVKYPDQWAALKGE